MTFSERIKVKLLYDIQWYKCMLLVCCTMWWKLNVGHCRSLFRYLAGCSNQTCLSELTCLIHKIMTCEHLTFWIKAKNCSRLQCFQCKGHLVLIMAADPNGKSSWPVVTDCCVGNYSCLCLGTKFNQLLLFSSVWVFVPFCLSSSIFLLFLFLFHFLMCLVHNLRARRHKNWLHALRLSATLRNRR